jgi:hypothetical protein
VLSHSVEDAGQERDDSADEDERNGRCEQATNPDANLSHLRLNGLTLSEIRNITYGVFGLRFLYT